MTKRGVIFDLDGCLAVNSEQIAMPAAVNTVCDYVGKQKKSPIGTRTRAHYVQKLRGLTIAEIGAEISKDYRMPLPPDMAEQIMTNTIVMLGQQARAAQGASDAIIALRADELDISIATSSVAKRVIPTLQAAKLNRLFPRQNVDWFSAVDSLPEPKTKPEPHIYLHAMQQRGLTHAIAVEDSPAGAAAAVAANRILQENGAGKIDLVGFIGGSHLLPQNREQDIENLINAGAFMVIHHMSALPDVVRTHFRINSPTRQNGYQDGSNPRQRFDFLAN